MSEEQKETSEEKKKNLRMSSVLAAALAAVTAALLGSTLGVAGTVIGAGVASVVSTVGGELYLRSLQRTRDAARKAMETAARRSRAGLTPVHVPIHGAEHKSAAPGEAPTAYLPADLANMPTVRLSELQPTEPEKADSLGEKLRKMRWPLIIGSSAVAFIVALVVLVGLDWTTQGGVSTGLVPRQPDTSQHEDDHRDDTPSTAPQTPPPSGESRSNNPTSAPTTTPSAPPSSQATQEQTRPPSSSSKPSTSSQAPSASQTPTAPAAPSNAGQ